MVWDQLNVVPSVELDVELELSKLMTALAGWVEKTIKRKTKKAPAFLPAVGNIATLLNFNPDNAVFSQ
jgi:hypothetical protein